jgi:signal transduction histidine kinase/ligand-binding sensor domain-containing protein
MTSFMLRLRNWCAAILLLPVGSAMAAAAQDYTVKTWGVDDGLPESSITDAVQSRDGYLWVSTLNSGLSRFDGMRFVNFDLPFASQFTSGGARRLFADQEGTLWINGFGNYLASLRGNSFQLEQSQPVVINYLVARKAGRVVFATKEGQLLEGIQGGGTNAVWKIIAAPGAGQNGRFFEDAQGGFWYRATNGTACRLTGERAEIMPPPGSGGNISVMAGDNQGAIAVGNAEGAFVWREGRFQELTPTNGERPLVVKGLASDSQGGWWVEANGRLQRCRDRRWIAKAPEWREQRRSWPKVRWDQADSAGGLWLAYTEGGVVHVSASGKLSALTVADGLPSNRVRTLSQDREGNAWASFERGGLVRIRPRLFQTVGSREGLADSVTTSVCEDEQGAIWIGTLSGAVSRWHEGVCSNFTLPLQGTHCEMSTVFPDASGRVWVGTHGNGLLVYEAGGFHHVLTADRVGINIRGILVSRDQCVWVASQDGLFCYAGNEVQRVLRPKSEADYPTALADGAGEAIWAAMNTGVLLKVSKGGVMTFRPPDAAMRCRFSAVCEDGQGTVWIGTLGSGLLRFRDRQFTALTKRDGLPTDIISQVLDDGEGGLWLGSPEGIISVRKKSLDAPRGESVCRVFGRDDGLPTVGCATASQPTAWRGHDGRLWFATANGVTCLHPRDSEAKVSPPLVVLEDVLVDGQIRNPSPGVAKAPLRLGPGRHHLEFRFAGLSFASPERVRFKYILEGLDSAWMENRAERAASYSSVPPGDYRFRVLACSGDGVWSETEASLALVLPPHLWETRWFPTAALGVILLAVAGSVVWTLQIRHRRELRVLEQQQALERERRRIAQDIHDDLGASLTRITMLSQSALNNTASPHPSNNEASRIYATARAMTNAMDEIVWAINPRHDSLESVAAYFAEFVEEFLSPAGLRFRIDFPLALPPWTINAEIRHNLFLAFKEALNNAVKHSKASEVVVSLEVRKGSFVLSVQDNGCSFESAATGENQAPPGRAPRGDGLDNMRRRIEGLGGHCVVDGVPGRGTRVSFEIALQP